MKGIDICWHENGEGNAIIYDWRKVKQAGYDFIIPRDGWGTHSTDAKLVEYCQRAQEAGLTVPGVYHFVYAKDLWEAILNAQCAIRNVEAAHLPKETVIWCDIEYDTVANARDKRGTELTPADIRAMAESFCNYVLAQGYPTGIYCNKDYLVNQYGEDIADSYDIWLADLEGDPDYPCLYRQYDWHTVIPGITGTVDADELIGYATAGTALIKKEKKMIKASELLKQIHDVVDNIPTVYEQGSNWGAWNGSAYRLDCIIFVKCMVYWGWYKPEKNKAHGGATYDPNYDWTEPAILSHCSNVSKKNFLSAKPCEYLYMDGHGGFKIDEFTQGGRTFNVAECTWASAWGAPRKCIYSYVDDNGGRWSCKGGIRNGTWEAHGELYGVDYSEEIMPEPEPTATQIPMDKFISFLPWIQKGSTGDYVKLLQNCLKEIGYYTDAVDGSAGNNTDKAMKAYQKAVGLYPDGIFGTRSWSKLLGL